LIDGTPVYDIKPYLPYAECVPDARAGFATAEIPRLTVEIDGTAAADFAALPDRARTLVTEALSFDVRPATRAGDDGRVFGARLCGHNVRFVIDGPTCRVIAIAKE